MPISVVLVAACSFGGDDDANQHTFSTDGVVLEEGDDRPAELLALPLTSLRSRSVRDEQTVTLAAEIAIADCMKELGFEYPVINSETSGLNVELDEPFGPWTQEEVEVDGYKSLEPPVPLLPEEEALRGLSTAQQESWWKALSGVDEETKKVTLPDGDEVDSNIAGTDGCSYQGLSAVYGDFGVHSALRQEIDELLRDAAAAAADDDAVQDAAGKWSGCMADKGYQFDDPKGPLALYKGEYRSEQPDREASGVKPDELEVATADVACKQEVELRETWLGARQAEEQEQVDRNPEVIEAWQEDQAALIERAIDIVEQEGG